VGISYYGRTFEEGKKIGWKDGFRAIYCILKYNHKKALRYVLLLLLLEALLLGVYGGLMALAMI
jgi:hypothetical protein